MAMAIGMTQWAYFYEAFREVHPAPAIAALRSAVEEFEASPAPARHPVELGEDLVHLRHLIDRLELQFAERAAAFAKTDGYERGGSSSPIDWLRHNCKMSRHAAEGAVCVGEQRPTLPNSAAAMHKGDIGFAHLTLMSRTARAVRDSPAGASFDELCLLDKAKEHSVGRFRYDCAHARHALDAKGVLAEHVELVDARTLELQSRDDGAVIVNGFLDPVGGATLRTALEPLARFNGKDDQRPHGKRLADALVELAHHTLDSGVLPITGGARTHLQVTATVETLAGLPGAPAGALQHAPPVPAPTVQRLACDAGLSRVLLDSKSVVVNVGRARRLPGAATRRALHARDAGCVWPSCDRASAWTSAHHLVHWAHGGKTDADNLVLLCHRHHWMVHEGGWQVVRTKSGRIVSVPPLPDKATVNDRADSLAPFR
jgi:hypothetical protein